MWLLFAALTVVFWGSSETIFKKSCKADEHSVAHLLAYNGIFFGIIGFIYMLIVYRGFNFDYMNVLRYLPIASVFILSMWSYYHAMKAVKISIVSPIVNTSCLVTVLLSIFILREHPSAMNIVAIALIILSLIMLSINKTPEDDIEKIKIKPKWSIYIFGLVFAFGYFILDGVASFLDAWTLEGWLHPDDILISHSIISFAVAIGCYIYLKLKDKSYKIQLDKPKLMGSALETAGEFTYIYALATGFASIVSPFVASYSVVTIILSRIFLKEKLKARQYIWAAAALVGVIMLSIE